MAKKKGRGRERETERGIVGVMQPLSISMADSHGECTDGGGS